MYIVVYMRVMSGRERELSNEQKRKKAVSKLCARAMTYRTTAAISSTFLSVAVVQPHIFVVILQKFVYDFRNFCVRERNESV